MSNNDLEPPTVHFPPGEHQDSESQASTRSEEKQNPPKESVRFEQRLLRHRWFAWVIAKQSWRNWKPVIRCAVAAWLGFVMILIVPVERVIGYAAFFTIIVAFIIPPASSIIQNIEVFLNLFFFCAVSWAWCCLGIFIASKVRIEEAPGTREAIYDGTYIEAESSVVYAVFLGVGVGVLLLYKLKTQPSASTFPLVLSCILIDITLTTAVFYPDPMYTTGLLFFLPMAIQAGLAILCMLLIFPESVGHSFQAKFPGVLHPLQDAMVSIEQLFATSRSIEDTVAQRVDRWADQSKDVRAKLLSSLAGLPPLRAQQRYLAVDFSYSRLSSHDLRELFDGLAVLQTRSGGLAFFFDVIVTNARHTHIDSSAFSVAHSQATSRPASIREVETPPPDEPEHRRHFPFLPKRNSSPFGHRDKSHVSLLDHLRKMQQPVGVYESQRYMEVERGFNFNNEHTLEQLGNLADISLPLIQSCKNALEVVEKWILTVNRDRHVFREKRVSCPLEDVATSLQSALDNFQAARSRITQPYRHFFDSSVEDYLKPGATDKMQYRTLYQSFVAQYHFIEFSKAILELVRLMKNLDNSRTRRRIWYPKVSTLFRHVHESHLTDGDDGNTDDAAFREEIQEFLELGVAKKRNPEYTPFDSPLLNMLSKLARFTEALKSKSLMYGVKAGILGVLTTLPVYLSQSASFYYYNRGVWVAIMAQLTLAVYSGDTTSAWLARLIASFWGCVLGMAAWYIGSGSGQGNAYGLGAVAAVTFPMAMFFRLHFPGQLLTAVFGPVTFALVLGYSYLNGSLGQLTEAGWGWDVAWRRFVCVVIGITAAWIFSFVPPSFSAKRAIRNSYAQIIAASGTIFCDVLSHANDHHFQLKDNMETMQKLLNNRTKLNKLGVRHANASYEYSLRGRWPEERYRALLEALQDALSLLSQLNHLLIQLDRPWRRALLDRTRLSDLTFLGDITAVIALCATSLRAGTPLPQITPSPLVARFRAGRYQGLGVPDPADAGDVPSLVTVDVLESETYMRYALGVTTTFSLLSRLDRIVVICKTLLGETYHISGLHLEELPQSSRV